MHLSKSLIKVEDGLHEVHIVSTGIHHVYGKAVAALYCVHTAPHLRSSKKSYPGFSFL
jgi:hypothetical protein